MRSTIPPFARCLGLLTALAPLAGCAGAPLRLDVSPSRGPTIGATIGPLTVAGRVDLGRTTAGSEGPRWNPPPTAASASAARVLATADRYVGTPYRYGGESPATGFDCSGFVQYVFGRNGVELPRTSALQSKAGHAAGGISALQPGDLMFFATEGAGVNHVAIYAGDGRVIHSTSGSGRVRYDGIDTDRGEWLMKRFVGSRRVLRARSA